jgi:hypothetical protein
MPTATEPTTRTVMAFGPNADFFVMAFWIRCEYDEKGNLTYYEDSNGWYRREYDENGNKTYYEDSNGTKKGTKRGSCSGKVIEVDGKKYKLMEL